VQAVVGHEMTHGFDDKGRKFDFVGNMRDWWTVEDGRQFDMRAEVMVRQAESFSVHGVSLKGKLTCGENIADLGGLKLAFRALSQLLAENASKGKEAPLINGFTPQQRFFLAWAQCWRENSRIERALQLVTIDPHGPNEWRCNGPLSNMSEFYAAFDVHPEDAMFRPPAERVDIW
jgi:putative endopeptidase